MDTALKEQFVQVMFRLRKSTLEFPSELGIRPVEFFLMHGIAGGDAHHAHPNGKFDLSDVHEHLHITKSAVSQMLNALEKRGYIRREINRTDRRKIAVVLTDEGRAVMRRAKGFMDELLNLTADRFGEESMRQLVKLLMRLAEVSEEIEREALYAKKKGDNELD